MPLDGRAAVMFVAYAAWPWRRCGRCCPYKSAAHARRLWRWAHAWAQACQDSAGPRGAAEGAENPHFRKAAAYVASLPSLEDADAACVLSSASKSNDFSLQLGPGHTAHDAFLGARLAWTNGGERLVLRVRRHARACCAPTCSTSDPRPRRPGELPQGRAYYHRLGRVWRRSYLLYGPPGTGKSTFAAAMARFLGYDVYDIDLSRAGTDDLRALLLDTAPRSVILVEDLDRYLRGGDGETSAARAARVLGFMDGLSSCCGEERVMVFTMSGGGKEGVDPAVLRPGRLDVHIHFTMCDFDGFKALASNYLGLKDLALPSGGGGLPPAPAWARPARRDHARQPRIPSRALHRHQRAAARGGGAAAQADEHNRRAAAELTSRLSGHLDRSSARRRRASRRWLPAPAGVQEGRADEGVQEAVRADQDQEPQGGGVVPVDDTASANRRGNDASSEKDR
ncbi:hypothetical protein ZWY2020_042388 [Hordeum vulgare]|nr:hypothetical protein ZWY2020_042388 [Hordeum vulgare]